MRNGSSTIFISNYFSSLQYRLRTIGLETAATDEETMEYEKHTKRLRGGRSWKRRKRTRRCDERYIKEALVETGKSVGLYENENND